MAHAPQIKIPATYMRGGTSKGVFFKVDDLPEAAQQAGEVRDNLLLRVIGSPDPYGKQTDGMGGATSSTSKTVLLSKSSQPDHDVDYLFGQVAIDKAFVDWSGNCGNLSAAVGPFAIANGLIDADRVPENGIATVRIWQANIKKTIVAKVPMTNGEVQETGDFELDGVTFPTARIKVDFIDPVDASEAMFPTGHVVDDLVIPALSCGDTQFDSKTIPATFINAGIPTIFVNAADLVYKNKPLSGTELQSDINRDTDMLAWFEHMRAHGAVQMGLINDISEAAIREHTPKIAFVSPPASYTASSGKKIEAKCIDLNVRALSMGQLHHAMMGTAAVAIAFAAVVPDTLVYHAATAHASDKHTPLNTVTFGHPSGTLQVGAQAVLENGCWIAKKASMSRSARRLMEGWVWVPRTSAL